jgi:lysyl-tRNA synthetase class I
VRFVAMAKNAKDINEEIENYKLELIKAKERYNNALKQDSCKGILDSYHEIQKIKRTIQSIREEAEDCDED